MRSRKVTLEESIVRLASETGASPSFVEKVRALFLGRGIDLEDSSEPYTAALIEAFHRHSAIRERLDEARESLVRLHTNIAELGEVFQDHLSRLRGDARTNSRALPEVLPRPRRERSKCRAGARRDSVARFRREGDAGDHEHASEHHAHGQGFVQEEHARGDGDDRCRVGDQRDATGANVP